MTASRPLGTIMVEKVWGRPDLPPPFAAPAGKRIGEIWFEPPPEMDRLLVKFLFTSENLSVQVHPSDAQAQDGEDGKEECWLVLAAEPGARIGVGLRERIDVASLRAAAVDGSIEKLIEWHSVAAGDFFYLPARTIHAIGGGLSLVEIQQNSDTTFRLYDYGRPRELHLDRGLAVALREPYPRQHARRVSDTSECLVDGPHFRVDRVVGAPDRATRDAYAKGALALPLSGELVISGGRLAAGHCAYVRSIEEADFALAQVTLLMRPA